MARARSQRIVQDSRDRATMIIAASCAEYSEETSALAAYLRVSGQLTAGLALRALLCGQTGLFEATLAELTGMAPRRIAGLAKDPASSAFAALYAKAGLPPALLIAFRAALAALARKRQDETEDGALRLPVIQAVLDQCIERRDESLDRLVALLRRFEADAAIEQGKRGMARIKSEAAEAAPERIEPEYAVASAPEAVALAQNPALQNPALTDAAPIRAMVEPYRPDEELEVFIDLDALEKELMAA
jgi:hypothetical protein